ncbi:hypothetical protein P7K49_021040 [Saguinus oedipus]|uniref:Uncharacterized protein n=1 Tax=Saguinus oedipus TaxID=9490 RepID=A0ABQ9URI3_SAGOE|nr:hypothetical protein P7K49_021040 [Saguinus oedipus]
MGREVGAKKGRGPAKGGQRWGHGRPPASAKQGHSAAHPGSRSDDDFKENLEVCLAAAGLSACPPWQSCGGRAELAARAARKLREPAAHSLRRGRSAPSAGRVHEVPIPLPRPTRD